LVVAVDCFPSGAVMVTVACGITAPVGSVTLPATLAVWLCANAGTKLDTRIKMAQMLFNVFPLIYSDVLFRLYLDFI